MLAGLALALLIAGGLSTLADINVRTLCDAPETARPTRGVLRAGHARPRPARTTRSLVEMLIVSEFALLGWIGGLIRRDIRERAGAHADLAAQDVEREQVAQSLTLANVRLQHASHRFEELYQALSVPCVCYDAAGRIFEWNRAFETCSGLGGDQIFQKRVWEIVGTPEQAAFARSIVPEVFAGNARPDWEQSHTRADGGVHHLLCSAHPLRDPAGEIVGAINTYLDITARKDAEAAMQRAERKYRAIFENAVEGIFQTTPGGQILNANRAMARMLGHESLEELMAYAAEHPAWHYVDPDDRTRFRDILERHGRVSAFEVEMRCKEGRHVWVSMNAHTERGKDGVTRYYEGTLEDITERKQAAEAMHKQQNFMKALLDNLQEGIVACGADGTLTLFNEATRLLHGLPQQPLPPEQWAEHFDLFLADGVTPMGMEDIPLFRAFQHERVFGVEMVIAPKHGPARTLLASGQTIRDAQGERLGAVVAMHDITERKAAQRQLERSEERLRAFHDITAGSPPDSADKIERLLRLGCQEFGMTVGMVSRTDVQRYQVLHAVSPEGGVPIGFTCETADILCREAQRLGRPLALDHVAGTPWRDHSAYALARPEAYLGTPLWVAGEAWGALCFTASQSREPFAPAEEDFLRLMGQWIGNEIERQRHQQAMQDSEARFRSAISSMQGGLIVQDEAGIVVLCNESAERILGVPAEELLHRPAMRADWRLLRPDGSDFPPDEHPGRAALATGRPQQDVVLGIAPAGGDVTWLSMNAAPLFHVGGDTLYAAVVTFTDITERRGQEVQIASHLAQIKDYTVVLEFQKQELEAQKQDLVAQKRTLERTNMSLEIANSALESLATLDGLTGLKNHRVFQEKLESEVKRAQRHGLPLSLVLLDVDRFKQYNDTFGHPAGDEVLRVVGRLLQEGGRETDYAARYGGEEFALILPDTDRAGAHVVAERLRAAIEAEPWPCRAVTASFGLSTLTPTMADRAALVAAADQALYASKSGGRNRATHADILADDRAARRAA